MSQPARDGVSPASRCKSDADDIDTGDLLVSLVPQPGDTTTRLTPHTADAFQPERPIPFRARPPTTVVATSELS
jgi:hypothetical protein